MPNQPAGVASYRKTPPQNAHIPYESLDSYPTPVSPRFSATVSTPPSLVPNSSPTLGGGLYNTATPSSPQFVARASKPDYDPYDLDSSSPKMGGVKIQPQHHHHPPDPHHHLDYDYSWPASATPISAPASARAGIDQFYEPQVHMNGFGSMSSPSPYGTPPVPLENASGVPPPSPAAHNQLQPPHHHPHPQSHSHPPTGPPVGGPGSSYSGNSWGTGTSSSSGGPYFSPPSDQSSGPSMMAGGGGGSDSRSGDGSGSGSGASGGPPPAPFGMGALQQSYYYQQMVKPSPQPPHSHPRTPSGMNSNPGSNNAGINPSATVMANGRYPPPAYMPPPDQPHPYGPPPPPGHGFAPPPFDHHSQVPIGPGGGYASGPMRASGHAKSRSGGSEKHENKKHACGQCGRAFARPSALQTHMYSHSGEKPHVCNSCGRAFSVLSNLRRHAKVHRDKGEKERPDQRYFQQDGMTPSQSNMDSPNGIYPEDFEAFSSPAVGPDPSLSPGTWQPPIASGIPPSRTMRPSEYSRAPGPRQPSGAQFYQ